MSNSNKKGGYQNLVAYQIATVIFDLTYLFVKRYIDFKSRTKDQMEQAARSGKQNIVEASLEKSLKLNINLTGVARASFGELLEDFKDYLRMNNLELWEKNDPRVREIRSIRISPDSTNLTNWSKWTNLPESFANLLISLTSMDCYLLDQLIRRLEEKFINEGGYSENLYQKRVQRRRELDK